MGVLPDHLDAHHFVHLYPPLFEVYVDLADNFKLPARIPFPRQAAELDRMPPIIAGVPPETARSIVHADQQQLAARSIKSTDHFVATFYDKTISVPFLMEILASLPQGSSELMTHPGLLDDQLRKESKYNVQREDELAVLTNPQMIDYLARIGHQTHHALPICKIESRRAAEPGFCAWRVKPGFRSTPS